MRKLSGQNVRMEVRLSASRLAAFTIAVSLAPFSGCLGDAECSGPVATEAHAFVRWEQSAARDDLAASLESSGWTLFEASGEAIEARRNETERGSAGVARVRVERVSEGGTAKTIAFFTAERRVLNDTEAEAPLRPYVNVTSDAFRGLLGEPSTITYTGGTFNCGPA